MSLSNASRKGVKARRMVAAARAATAKFKNPMFGEMYAHAVEQSLEHGNDFFIKFMQNLEQPPVGIEEFLDSEQFMGATDLTLWPEVRRAVIEINQDWWKGPGIANHEAVLMGATGCVDKDTEFLTPTGWKLISEYEDGDLVGQYHEDGSLTFVKPEEYVNMEYPMFFRLKTSTFDQMLTPGHRVIYRSMKTGELKEKPAEEIVSLHNGSKGGWAAGKFIGDYRFSGEGLAYSDDEIRLMVAVMADGSFYKRAGRRPNYCVFHIKRQDKKDRLVLLLDACGIPYNRYDRQNGFSDISFLAPERNKIYEGWWVASQDQLQTIADEVLRWDGTVGRDEYYTRDKHSADYIQHVFCATGRRATINSCVRDDGSVDYVVHVVKSKNWGISSSRKQDIELVDSPDGRCYCFRLPTGMWASRRSGKVVITGNTGKSELAKVTTAYHLHILGCLKSAQALYGLPQATSIVFVIQAAKPHVTKKVVYMPLRNYVEAMPWFQRHMRPHKLIEAEMYFEHKNLRVVPGGSDSDAILGEAIIGGVIDEINFMNIVQKSKKADVGTGRTGIFDQAQSIYDALSRRKKSRFIFQGPQIGVICCSSSTRYKGDFTDKRKQQVADHAERGVYIYEKAQYEVWPQERYCGDKFRIVVENEAAMDIRILEDEQKTPEGATVFEVPIEYKPDFQKDPAGSLRDIIGRSVNSINPFFRRRYKITDAVDRGQDIGLESFVYKDNVVLGMEGMPQVKRGHYCKNPGKPRYVHIDLSATGDSCGIVMVRFDGMVEMERAGGIVEILPKAVVELAVSISPDHSSELDIAEVRAWVRQLKRAYGYPVKAVSYDGWACVSGDARIWTGRGLLRADQVEVGDVVQTRSGPNSVEKVFSYGKAPALEVTTQTGHSIVMTHGHKVEALVGRTWGDGQLRRPEWEWCRADQLVEGDVVRIWDSRSTVDSSYIPMRSTPAYTTYKTYFYNQPSVLNEQVARILGVIFGDGSFFNGGFSVACAADESAEVVRLIREAFDLDCQIGCRRLPSQNSDVVQVWCQHLSDWFSLNSLDDKTDIPEAIRRSPLSVQAAFLSGLFATDGSVKERDGQVSIEQSRKAYIDYIADILSMGFGLRVNRSVRQRSYFTPNSDFPRSGVFYLLQVSGSRREFYETIGFAYDCKQNRLAEHLHIEGRRIYSKVESVRQTEAYVYDFQVANDHSYLANGFVSHNSLESRQEWRKQGMPTGLVSVDRQSAPYKTLRDAFNDDRIALYNQEVLIQELYDLEYDEGKDKIDHPPNGSKDVADALAGAYYTMITRASSWTDPQPDTVDPMHGRQELEDRYDEDRPV